MTSKLPEPIARSFEIVLETYRSWRDDRTLRLGAGLAYYALFAIVPFLAVTAALAEPLIGSVDFAEFMADRLEAIGVQNADAAALGVADQVDDRSTQTSLGLVGGISLLFAASLLFLALTDAINTIWDEPVHTGWRNTIRRRLLSFVMVLISSAALILQLAATAIVGAADALIPGDSGVLEALAPFVASGISVSGLGAIVILLFRFMSPGEVPWFQAIVAGIVTALMMVMAATTVGWYLKEFGGASVAGTFGAILAVLTWVYVEAQIVLAGVQFSKTLTLDQRSRTQSQARTTATGMGEDSRQR